MACEARIVRVLRALEYPKLATLEETTSTTLDNRPDELARIVSWLEDRKIRHRAIADRAPLRTAGPHWDEAFFTYLREMDCPYDLKPASTTGAGGEGQAESSSGRLRGLSWLVGEAAAEEFADRGQEYAEAARKIISQSPSVQVGQAATARPASESPPPPPSAALLGAGEGGAKVAPTASGVGLEGEDGPPVAHADGVAGGGGAAVARPPDLSGSVFGASDKGLDGKPAAAAAAAAAVVAPHLGMSPSPAAPGEDKKSKGNDGMDYREEKKSNEKGCVDHGEGKKSNDGVGVGHGEGGGSSGNAAVPVGQDGSGEDGQGDGDRVHDELEGFSAGVDTGDETCDRVATVLRMLYLSDLRTLQDEVNGILAMAQTGGP